MKIDIIAVGFLKENCYVITLDNKTLIIDPGAEAEEIINFCKNKNVVGILLTHHHFDHVGALKQVKDYFNVDIFNNFDEIGCLAINTPGHTSDSLTYYFPDEKVMFTGDFLFKGTIGRTDLPTGSLEDMKNSLDIIKNYPKDIKIYPGHGNPSTLKEEIPNFSFYINNC